jgi:hypothetical protein
MGKPQRNCKYQTINKFIFNLTKHLISDCVICGIMLTIMQKTELTLMTSWSRKSIDQVTSKIKTG